MALKSLRGLGLGLVLLMILPLAGCSYLTNRGNDLADIADIGATYSSKPTFSLYANFLSLLSLGYSNFDGRFYGLAERDFGAHDARQHAAGLLVWGREQFGYDDYDLKNPDSPPSWRVGLVGLPMGPLPPAKQAANCPKMLHLGWVGLTVNCKFGQLADFILGWTTIDIMGDDTAGKAKAKAAPMPPSPPPAPATVEKTAPSSM